MIRTTNIRALKDRLSAFLRDVQRGDIILVTDRGRVVAEIRQPTLDSPGPGAVRDRARALVEAGILTIGLPNSPEAYRSADVRLPAKAVARALDETRGDR